MCVFVARARAHSLSLFRRKTHWGGLNADENGEALQTGLARDRKLLPQPCVLQSQIWVYQFTQHLQSPAQRTPGLVADGLEPALR